ncbi:hypothetical protein C3Y87_03005 [Carbonactinospora thermoautotrophica]|uniref:cell division protein PerM n=1 Tax=Carbonactinospora thermoautotrophica TaxID=1469144 RepID=UPI00226FEB6B|nr:DUF6350 family protein [Carbonactinospora thermoautotrophica]MCX9190401.1 hypothetical protein [Carbonactinospora thermoautotrophica]
MTATQSTAQTSSPGPRRQHPRSALTVGLVAAVWAAGMGVVLIAGLVLVCWAAAPRGGVGAERALRAAVQIWLVAQHASLQLPTGTYALTPLGLTLLPAYLLFRAGRWAATTARVRDAWHVVQVLAAFVLGYAALVLLAAFGPAQDARPHPGRALAGAATLVLICGGAGVLRGARLLGPALRRVPFELRVLGRATAAAVAVLLAGGAGMVAAGLIAHFGEAERMLTELDAGPVGGVGVLAVCLAFVPTATVWGVAYLLGPGFAVGTDAAVALGGTRLGAVPALPLFAALPAHGPAPAWWYALYAIPVLAGMAGGLLLVRDAGREWAERGHSARVQGRAAEHLVEPSSYAWALAAGLGTGLGTGLALALLATVSRGPIAGGRMSELGPPVGPVATAGGAEVAVVAVVTASVATFVRRRAVRRGAPRLGRATR